MAIAAVSATRSNFADLFGTTMLPVLEELFRSKYEQHPMIRDQIFKTSPTDRDIWQYSETHDMPLFSSVAEGADYAMSRPKAGTNKTLTPVKYGLGFSISEEAVEDGRFDMVADAVSKMGQSARESQEQSAMNILNNGFSTALVSDGLSLFHNAHTTPSAVVTIRNQLAVASDLSSTSLKTAIADFEKNFKGDSGIIKAIRPKYLVVPSELRLYAKELLGSDQMADTADNNLNSLKGEGIQVISSPRLTDFNAWFLIADSSENGLRVVSRKPVETKAADPAVGWINDSVLYKARYREIVAAVHPHGCFGSPGAT